MRIRWGCKKVVAMTMVALMLPWSSFVYGTNVEAASNEAVALASPNDASSVQKPSG